MHPNVSLDTPPQVVDTGYFPANSFETPPTKQNRDVPAAKSYLGDNNEGSDDDAESISSISSFEGLNLTRNSCIEALHSLLAEPDGGDQTVVWDYMNRLFECSDHDDLQRHPKETASLSLIAMQKHASEQLIVMSALHFLGKLEARI